MASHQHTSEPTIHTNNTSVPAEPKNNWQKALAFSQRHYKKAILTVLAATGLGYGLGKPGLEDEWNILPHHDHVSIGDTVRHAIGHQKTNLDYLSEAKLFHALYDTVKAISRSRVGELLTRGAQANFIDIMDGDNIQITAGHASDYQIISIRTINKDGKDDTLRLTCRDGGLVTLDGPTVNYQNLLEKLQDFQSTHLGTLENESGTQNTVHWMLLIALLGMVTKQILSDEKNLPGEIGIAPPDSKESDHGHHDAH